MSLSSPYILSVAHGPHFIESKRNIKSDVGGNPVSHKALFCSQCWSMLVNLNIYEAFQTMWRANWRKNFYEPDLVKDKLYIDLVHAYYTLYNQMCTSVGCEDCIYSTGVELWILCGNGKSHIPVNIAWFICGFCICVIFLGLSVYSFCLHLSYIYFLLASGVCHWNRQQCPKPI